MPSWNPVEQAKSEKKLKTIDKKINFYKLPFPNRQERIKIYNLIQYKEIYRIQGFNETRDKNKENLTMPGSSQKDKEQQGSCLARADKEQLMTDNWRKAAAEGQPMRDCH